MNHALSLLLFCALVALPARSQDRSGPMPLSYAVDQLAEKLILKIPKSPQRRVAVTPLLELDGTVTKLGVFLAERLSTRLLESGIPVVERSRLDAVIGEIQLNQSRAFDGETAKKLGKQVGADLILTGSITELATFVELNTRLVDVESGGAIAAAQVGLVKDQDLLAVMGQSLGPGALSVPDRGLAGSRKEPTRPSLTQAGVKLELLDCNGSGTTLTCSLVVTSQTADRQLGVYTREGSRVFDSSGQEFVASQGTLGAKTIGKFSRTVLPADVPVRLILQFEGTPSTLTELVALEVTLYDGRSNNSFKFRSVSVSR